MTQKKGQNPLKSNTIFIRPVQSLTPCINRKKQNFFHSTNLKQWRGSHVRICQLSNESG
jgi:hypothetical protein